VSPATLASSPKLGGASRTPQTPIGGGTGFIRSEGDHAPRSLTPTAAPGPRLLGFPADLLAIALASQRLFCAALVARLQVEAVLLDVLDDVFLLYLALETAKGVLDGLALLDLDLGQNLKHPQTMVKRGKTLFLG
jgi:hypothetical protein